MQFRIFSPFTNRICLIIGFCVVLVPICVLALMWPQLMYRYQVHRSAIAHIALVRAAMDIQGEHDFDRMCEDAALADLAVVENVPSEFLRKLCIESAQDKIRLAAAIALIKQERFTRTAGDTFVHMAQSSSELANYSCVELRNLLMDLYSHREDITEDDGRIRLSESFTMLAERWKSVRHLVSDE